MTEPISLHSFCKENGNLPKTSVRRWLNEHGYSTSEGLSALAVEAALEQFCPAPAPIAPTADAPTPVAGGLAIRPDVLPDNFFCSGQLAPVNRREIDLPQGFDPTAMVRFFDGVAGQATDTSSLVAIADMALGAVDRAMAEKLQAQRAELTQAERDAQALATKMAEAKTRLQVSALESKMIAERQTSATTTAEAAFAELMRLGKPAEPSTAADTAA